jgi:hypothetical protein
MKNLLITTVGEYNLLYKWMDGERNFDIALVNYDFHEVPSTLCSHLVWYDEFQTFKYPGIYQMFWDDPNLLKYDYFFMPDEDIDISCGDINNLFNKARTMNFDLCCPSIEKSDTSFPSWEVFVTKPFIDIALVNFIEVMCPVFSQKALKKCLDTFRKSQSGWGIDLVWPKLIGDNGNNIAVIHSIVAKHTRPIASGTLYADLQRKRISPSREKRQIMTEYKVSSIDIKEYGYRILDNDV